MALRLVRQTSETPNITNKDDVIMARYAYGGYNGVVKAFGNECDYIADSGIFKILSGRILVDGWEIDVDGEGYQFDFSNVYGTQYNSIYLQINVVAESVLFKSTYLTGQYPEIEKGDDLTSAPNGTANLLLYNVKVENGVITEILKRFEIVPYLLDVEQKLDGLIESLNNGQLKPKIAQYASEDTTKGTIEDRLTRLGFRSGVIRFAGDDYGSNENADTSTNGVFRQGNYVIGNINTQIYFSTSLASNYFADEKTLFVLPEQFRPKKELSFLFIINQVNTEEARFYNVTINTNGNAIITVLGLSSASTLNANYHVKLNFGFEANPI